MAEGLPPCSCGRVAGPGGLPSCSRFERWVRCASVEAIAQRGRYEQLLLAAQHNSPHLPADKERQLLLDVDRTCTQMGFFAEGSDGRRRLENVLRAWVVYDAEEAAATAAAESRARLGPGVTAAPVGYVQGMNFIATALLWHAARDEGPLLSPCSEHSGRERNDGKGANSEAGWIQNGVEDAWKRLIAKAIRIGRLTGYWRQLGAYVNYVKNREERNVWVRDMAPNQGLQNEESKFSEWLQKLNSYVLSVFEVNSRLVIQWAVGQANDSLAFSTASAVAQFIDDGDGGEEVDAREFVKWEELIRRCERSEASWRLGKPAEPSVEPRGVGGCNQSVAALSSDAFGRVLGQSWAGVKGAKHCRRSIVMTCDTGIVEGVGGVGVDGMPECGERVFLEGRRANVGGPLRSDSAIGTEGHFTWIGAFGDYIIHQMIDQCVAEENRGFAPLRLQGGVYKMDVMMGVPRPAASSGSAAVDLCPWRRRARALVGGQRLRGKRGRLANAGLAAAGADREADGAWRRLRW
ncbi:unnamed protein product [Prorocentrum cordatum]|uniref:Uncharacterized protein n=1 Tax=Prorocentrum cordatum TaxID=2364126 RepID=A0ABN9PZ23_9DINO|nr:unnamed protein product [Polarella glacialis]